MLDTTIIKEINNKYANNIFFVIINSRLFFMIAKYIEELLHYSKTHLHLQDEDLIFYRNRFSYRKVQLFYRSLLSR